ncbi:transcription factor PAR1 [Eucalyptus grandis]|uniref:Uncharacterized protein n=2 Tax=Eucalyptus grandis TaxID=71139 RepID=A0ACC3JGS1_EUCGR|nr:transcription factor PAR1 [Eucalyptus grandis]KAK3413465.1 hypothetical protein EUGRSUZ_I02025 [Eucalyptus grandis]
MSSSTRTRSRTATASSAAASRRRRRASKLARACMSKRRRPVGGTCSSSSSNDAVSEKLEALKNLIPVTRDGGDDAVATDELFQETADYILRLRTQVVVLQKLIHFYGSADLPEKQREIDDASSVL